MKLIVGCIVLFGMVSLGFGAMRTWTSLSGQTLEAEYVRDSMGKVWLKTSTGKVKQIPISGLSQVDRDYINLRHPPKLEIKADDNKKGLSVKGDIDNRKESLQFEVEIRKTSKQPYSEEMTAYLFVLGRDISDDEYILLDTQKESFVLTPANNNSYTFKGKRVKLEYDPDPPWGEKYEGYLVCIKTSDGDILMFKGKKRFEKNLNILMKAKVNDRFDEDMRPLNNRR